MKIALFAFVFLLSCNSNSKTAMDKTINYVVMPNGEMYCMHSRIERCGIGLKNEILNNGGIYKADGVFRQITYNPWATPKQDNCGKIVYNPKNGKSFYVRCK